MSGIRLDGVSQRYGGVTALDRLDLEVRPGELLALLGPSGCGKTTALRLIAGFLQPSAGRVLIDGRDISDVPPHQRNVGMVFQEYALFPHLSVEDNIAFGLVERRWRKADIRERVAELLALVKLPEARGRYPGELSGGQQQRVALARALAFRPEVLLMDEPFGALDLKLRETMQDEVVRIQRRLAITTLFVTHDQGEAMAMAHRIAVMNAGRVEQLGTPAAIYHAPASRFVAGFVGKINLIEARITGLDGVAASLDAGGVGLGATAPPWARPGMAVAAAMRPEHLAVLPAEVGGAAALSNRLEGIVARHHFLGGTLLIEVETAAHGVLSAVIPSGEGAPETGARVALRWAPRWTVLLPQSDPEAVA